MYREIARLQNSLAISIRPFTVCLQNVSLALLGKQHLLVNDEFLQQGGDDPGVFLAQGTVQPGWFGALPTV